MSIKYCKHIALSKLYVKYLKRYQRPLIGVGISFILMAKKHSVPLHFIFILSTITVPLETVRLPLIIV
jgi:hypothetical protein